MSFQRFAWPSSSVIVAAPPSLGALPVATFADAGTALLPVARGEALWIGLDPLGVGTDAQLAIVARLASGRVIDVLSGSDWDEHEARTVSPLTRERIEGIARRDGAFDVIGRSPADDAASCTSLAFYVSTAATLAKRVDPLSRVAIEFVDYVAFHRRSGSDPPEPLDPTAGYRGHRLP